MPDPIPEIRKREIFRTLVETQDAGLAVSESRAHIAALCSIEIEQLIAIERAGVKANWPPLDITFPTPRYAVRDNERRANE